MFQIDRFGRTPIYEQIIEQAELLVATGTLKPGDLLPSVRSLSQALPANPNTLQKAYTELERRGIAASVPGSGRYVSADAPRIVSESMLALLQTVTECSRKLRTAGVEKQRVLGAVEAAFAPGPEETAAES